LPAVRTLFDEEAFELRAMLDGPQDASNAYLRVQAGTGGTEACDWAQMLLRMYARWAERRGHTTEIIDGLRHEAAGIIQATLHIVGTHAYGFLRGEVGIHRLVRLSPFAPQGRLLTSFAVVDVLPDMVGGEEIPPADLERHTVRTGGPGGRFL
jgi:peptide chain release factor 2